MTNNPENPSLKESSPNIDLVADFFVGSGTTSSVAHKMNRQFIGIEQMNYIETVAYERLKMVVEGEQGGISKTVEWQGGGSFTYLGLKKYNKCNAKNTIRMILSC